LFAHYFFIICQFKTKHGFKAVGKQDHTQNPIPLVKIIIGLELMDNGKIMS